MATCPINVTNMRAGAKKLGVPLVQSDYAMEDYSHDGKLCGVCAITACYAATHKRTPKDPFFFWASKPRVLVQRFSRAQ